MARAGSRTIVRSSDGLSGTAECISHSCASRERGTKICWTYSRTGILLVKETWEELKSPSCIGISALLWGIMSPCVQTRKAVSRPSRQVSTQRQKRVALGGGPGQNENVRTLKA